MLSLRRLHGCAFVISLLLVTAGCQWHDAPGNGAASTLPATTAALVIEPPLPTPPPEAATSLTTVPSSVSDADRERVLGQYGGFMIRITQIWNVQNPYGLTTEEEKAAKRLQRVASVAAPVHVMLETLKTARTTGTAIAQLDSSVDDVLLNFDQLLQLAKDEKKSDPGATEASTATPLSLHKLRVLREADVAFMNFGRAFIQVQGDEMRQTQARYLEENNLLDYHRISMVIAFNKVAALHGALMLPGPSHDSASWAMDDFGKSLDGYRKAIEVLQENFAKHSKATAVKKTGKGGLLTDAQNHIQFDRGGQLSAHALLVKASENFQSAWVSFSHNRHPILHNTLGQARDNLLATCNAMSLCVIK